MTNKQKNYIIIGIGMCLLLIGIAYPMYRYRKETDAKKAFNKIRIEVHDTDEKLEAYLDLIEHYENTKAASTASWCAATIYCSPEKQQYKKAINILKNCTLASKNMDDQKELLIGDAYLKCDDSLNARKHYERAMSSENYLPLCLYKIAECYEKSGELSEALARLEKICKEYPSCNEINDVKQAKVRVKNKLKPKKD